MDRCSFILFWSVGPQPEGDVRNTNNTFHYVLECCHHVTILLFYKKVNLVKQHPTGVRGWDEFQD